LIESKFMQHCELCGTNVQFGAHIYDGKFIPAYKLFVCSSCYAANWDGWAPNYESAVTRHLREDYAWQRPHDIPRNRFLKIRRRGFRLGDGEASQQGTTAQEGEISLHIRTAGECVKTGVPRFVITDIMRT
jgi:hypothetical protein